MNEKVVQVLFWQQFTESWLRNYKTKQGSSHQFWCQCCLTQIKSNWNCNMWRWIRYGAKMIIKSQLGRERGWREASEEMVEEGKLTHRLLAGHRALACHTQGTSTWASSHSSVGKRLRRSTADVHRSRLDRGQKAASSPAKGTNGRQINEKSHHNVGSLPLPK